MIVTFKWLTFGILQLFVHGWNVEGLFSVWDLATICVMGWEVRSFSMHGPGVFTGFFLTQKFFFINSLLAFSSCELVVVLVCIHNSHCVEVLVHYIIYFNWRLHNFHIVYSISIFLLSPLLFIWGFFWIIYN